MNVCDHSGCKTIIRMCIEIKCAECGQIITRRCLEEVMNDKIFLVSTIDENFLKEQNIGYQNCVELSPQEVELLKTALEWQLETRAKSDWDEENWKNLLKKLEALK